MASELVKTSIDDKIMTITLNRPDKRNAINYEMGEALSEAFEQAAMDDSVYIIVLRGEGACFCSGIDFNMLAELNQKFPTTPKFRFGLEQIQRIFVNMEKIEKPVIAVLHNYCYGMGTEMAAAADFRIAADDLRMGIQEVELGLIPDVGGTTRLTRLVGIPMAKELIMTARVLDVERAKHIGLINESAPLDKLDDLLKEWTDRLKGCAPLAVGLAKKLIDRCAHLDKLTFMEIEGLAQSTILKSEDVMEGVMARMQKRKPDFKGK